MGNSRKLQLAVRAALALASAGAAVPAVYAQQASPAATDTATTEMAEVVVTGSRIQSTNLVSISPVTTVTATDIAATGLTRVEDILNNLPQVFSGQNANVSNGSDGTATVDLHDLGAQRTLVLVNGRRLGPGGTTGLNTSDINQIPAQLIDKIEVLTGGASATYGADAVSGVVNFILNDHFQGVKIDANYGFYQHANHDDFINNIYNSAPGQYPAVQNEVNAGFNKDFAILMGSNFADGRGNATMYMTYTNTGAVLQGLYDHSACTLGGTRNATGTATAVACGGSGTSAGGEFLGYDANGVNVLDNTVDPKTGQFRAFAPQDLYNYGALNYQLRPNERWTGGGFLHFAVNDNVEVYGELMYMKNSSTQQLAPGGSFGDNTVSVNCGPAGVGLPGNPLLTAQERATLCAPGLQAAIGTPGVPNSVDIGYILRRNVEGGGRQAVFDNTSYRTVVGARGTFLDNFKYDVSAQYSTVQTFVNNLNYFSSTAVSKALNVVTGPNGAPTCASVIDGTDPACVPWNIWTPGGVTPAALNYLNIPNTIQGEINEYVVHGDIGVDLGKYNVKLPTAKDGMQLNVGAEWREDKSAQNPDYISQQGLASGGAGPIPPVFGQVHASEGFLEFNLPLVDDLPGIDQLAFQGGYRYSKYNLGFDTNTFKLGLEWAPIHDVRLRAGFNRAIRAPNISELYSPTSIGPGGTIDPCWGAAPTLTAAQCANTGVTAAQYGNLGVNSATQINTQSGGNPNLQPERADTKSMGIVFQPRWLQGFTSSLDYYDIRITNAIINSTGVGTAIVLDCAETADPTACGRIHRSSNGSLWLSPTDSYVQTPASNVGVVQTKQIDLKAHYALDVGAAGKLAFNLDGNYVFINVTTPIPGAQPYDCAGLFGPTCGNPLPKWRHTMSTDWAMPWAGLDLNVRWRYIAATSVETGSKYGALNYIPNDYPGFNTISNYSYIDASLAAEVAPGITVRVGANNLLDKDPPQILAGNCPVGACNGNTWTSYDTLGRLLYVHVTAKF